MKSQSVNVAKCVCKFVLKNNHNILENINKKSYNKYSCFGSHNDFFFLSAQLFTLRYNTKKLIFHQIKIYIQKCVYINYLKVINFNSKTTFLNAVCYINPTKCLQKKTRRQIDVNDRKTNLNNVFCYKK